MMTRSSTTLRHPHQRTTLRPTPTVKGATITLYLGLAYNLYTSHYTAEDLT